MAYQFRIDESLPFKKPDKIENRFRDDCFRKLKPPRGPAPSPTGGTTLCVILTTTVHFCFRLYGSSLKRIMAGGDSAAIGEQGPWVGTRALLLAHQEWDKSTTK